jgi:hypothetical protein
MAGAAEHALNTPIFAWLVLIAPQLFAAYSAINDLSFPKEMQAKLLDILRHTKTYTCLIKTTVQYLVSGIYNRNLQKNAHIVC